MPGASRPCRSFFGAWSAVLVPVLQLIPGALSMAERPGRDRLPLPALIVPRCSRFASRMIALTMKSDTPRILFQMAGGQDHGADLAWPTGLVR